MLTVKHIAPSRHETIYETKSTATEPNGPNSENTARVYYAQSDGSMGVLDTGTVYVMNEAGKTVATYHLGGWPEPQSKSV